MASLTEQKAEARKQAFARRKEAHARSIDATDQLVEAILELPGDVVAGYWPIRTEIDPRAALAKISEHRQIVLPVVDGDGLPLSFRFWKPDAVMIDGAFGAAIPANEAGAEPEVLIVPLAAFDDKGYRLGYGGGFYDRTLEKLRSRRKTLAVGFAYQAQMTSDLPIEQTDQPLDLMVTEVGTIRF